MIPELGHLALILALGVALLQGVMPLMGAQRGRADWMALGRPLAAWQALLVFIALGCLAASFVRHDFSVLYVATNSNSALPLAYRLAGVWGGHEGSLLLWLGMLSVWSLAVAAFSRSLPEAVMARVLAVMGWIGVGFLAFTLFTSNPFDRLIPAAPDGRDLNPLLQDPGMVFHPPMLYMGYVGFSVAYAFAIAALIGGHLDATWARWSRPWTVAAWIFLTLGIALGSAWAYYELGWGGWWFWDPVENASFMPWLLGTALIHSLAVTEKRGSFKAWTVLLAIVAFSLSLLGTFLVRSGVLSSVHAFATDPRRGLFILGFLVIVVGASLLLYAWRASHVGLGQRFAAVSKEAALLANNMLFAAACGAVLLGTLYPLFLDAMGLGKISVGPPYFDQVFTGLMAPMIFLLGVGPLARWKGDEIPSLARRVRWAAVVTVLAAAATAVLAGRASFGSVLGYLMAYWVAAGVLTDLAERLLPAARAGRAMQALRQIGRAQGGMLLAHLGVAAFILGVTVVRTHETERDVRMMPGDSTQVGGYQFTLKSLDEVPGPNYRAMQGTVEVTRNGAVVATLTPQKRIYRVQSNPMTEAAIDTNLARDLYVSMGEALPDGAWTLRVQHKPMITWIWLGCVLMSLGGALAVSDRRYRSARRATSTASAASAAQGAPA
ncbi:heme lyase CcmF/NrfE family subunit [Ideonella alba]|uniref:Heme lyase CcmF/NrfE family subunit n=1 Tax=Ideonella alba TaxID=2824118 RepID=A0A940YH57_9BURK|nr:heme lyase CcmF/NrfE family subunit [Ideonella alba]MBQ0929849.1 heme lyase CcmF/NrfE family subunit [Ideonella alba]